MTASFGASIGSFTSSATGNSQSFTTTALVPAGSKIIVAMYWWDGGASFNDRVTAVSDGSAFTQDRQVVSGDDVVALWFRDNPSQLNSGSTITMTVGASNIPAAAFFASAYYLTSVATGASEANTSSTSTGASWSTGAVSNITADAIYVGICGIEDPTAGTSSTPTNGTEIHDLYSATSQQGMVSQYLAVSAVSSQAIAGTLSNAGSTLNVAATAVYKGSSGLQLAKAPSRMPIAA